MTDYTLSETYNFALPKSLIATKPEQKRDECRLMVLENENISHKLFYNVVDYFEKGDVLVLNDIKVLLARIFAFKKTGGKVEILLLKQIMPNVWEAILKGKNLKDGDTLYIEYNNTKIEALIKVTNNNTKTIEFSINIDDTLLTEIGHIPLPPYIISERIERGEQEYYDSDKIYYQNVFAKNYGSAASPTASLHFTDALLDQIRAKGVDIVYITLHVGMGTFAPLKTERITEHNMHYEKFFISEQTASLIKQKKTEGKNIIASGTTVARVLESEYDNISNSFNRNEGETNIFIYPPYKFKCVDKLITNFHTPHSTLLAMVSAFSGYSNIMNAYSIAVNSGYRFFSYGDAMCLTTKHDTNN